MRNQRSTKKFLAALGIAGSLLLATAPAATAGSPTCADMFGSGWKNHGTHVLTYVHSPEGAGGGAPAHHASATFAPGASFCLPQAQSLK